MGYSREQIRQMLVQAGAPAGILSIMTAIGLAEQPNSDPNFVRVCPGNKYCLPGQLPEKSVGVFQINVLAHPEYSIEWLKNPINNARAALQIYADRAKKGGDGFRAWGSYVDGRYKQYLNGPGGDGGGFAGNVSSVYQKAGYTLTDGQSALLKGKVNPQLKGAIIGLAALVIIGVVLVNSNQI